MKANRSYFWQIAARNLKHGGQRAVLAILCILFGVMSLVGMNTLANTLRPALLVQGREILGGDFGVYMNNDGSFSEENRKGFEKLQAEGKIEGFTMIAGSYNLIFKLENDPVWHYVGNAMGVDTKTYPLAGNLDIADKTVKEPIKLLEQEKVILITADIAESFAIKTGDTLLISNINVGKPLKVTVAGIIIDTPNHEGDKIYYSYDLARALENGNLQLDTTMVNVSQEKKQALIDYADEIDCWVWSAHSLDTSRQERDSTVRLMLNSAGGLGLLVGGIGVANTMVVLISRRRKQIATWKLLGYENKHIRAIFLLEALMMGAIGSLIGAGLGVLLSKGLTKIFLGTATWLVVWKPDYVSVAIGLGAGMITSLLFTLWAILRASNVSPASVIRAEDGKAQKGSLVKDIVLLTLIFGVFMVMVTLIIGSVVEGLKYMGIAVLALILVCLFIAAAIWVLTALMPTKRFPQLFLARQHLRRGGITPIMAGAALFVGVLTIFFAALALGSSQNFNVDIAEVWEGPNAVILAPYSEEAAVRQAVAKLAPIETDMGYRVSLKSVESEYDHLVDHVIFGRESELGFSLEDSAPGESFKNSTGAWVMDEATYMPAEDATEFKERMAIEKAGLSKDLTVEFADGKVVEIPFAGEYMPTEDLPTTLNYFRPIYMQSDALKAITEPDQLQYYLKLSPEALKNMSQTLKELDEQAVVINMIDWLGRNIQKEKNFFILAVAMATLAFSAGFVLIANSVSLSILNRRYEIGVLKCVGYSQGKILLSFVLEYFIVAFTAFVAGLVATETLLFVVRHSNDFAMRYITLPPYAIGITALMTMGITALAVVLVAWKPIQVSPTIVLADRE